MNNKPGMEKVILTDFNRSPHKLLIVDKGTNDAPMAWVIAPGSDLTIEVFLI